MLCWLTNKHVEKSLICKNKHIRLIHIFEYEWDYNKEKIKSLIKQALGLFDRVISSIDCVVRELEENEYVNFLIDNSIDKPINSFIRYGLFYCDELISVVGLDKLDKREYELKQYCTKLNYKVVDGLSTLLLKIKDFDKIVTFADFLNLMKENIFRMDFLLWNIQILLLCILTVQKFINNHRC